MKLKLILSCLGLLVLTCFDYVLYIRWMQSMKNYKWYAGSLVFPLTGCLFFWIPVLINKTVIKKNYQNEYSFQQKKLFLLGVFDSTSSIMTSYSTPYLSVLIMSLVDKLSLPFTMIGSRCYLKTNYKPNHYLGAFLTLYGVLVAFIPEMMNGAGNLNIFWLVIYVFSIVPSVLSYLYKEKHLKTDNLDIWWMNAWISIWQLLFGLLTFPIVFAPLPSGEDLSLKVIPDYFSNATKCQFLNQGSFNHDHCHNSFWLLVLYQIVSTLANIVMFIIIREESSAVYIVLNTLKMPINAWLGSYPQLVGNQASSVNSADFLSFILIIVAIIVYNYIDEDDEHLQERRSSSDITIDLNLKLTNDSPDARVAV